MTRTAAAFALPRPALVLMALPLAAAAVLLAASSAPAQEKPAEPAPATVEAQPSAEAPGQPASLIAQIAGPDGAAIGTVVAAPTASGVMLLTISLQGAAAGIHGAHIHETGACEGPGFKSAGGHLSGNHQHGVMSESGVHPGDLPNLHIPDSGTLDIELFAPELTPKMLTDAVGSAFVLHADPDDYTSQPAGNSGDRIACGVFKPAT